MVPFIILVHQKDIEKTGRVAYAKLPARPADPPPWKERFYLRWKKTTR